MSGDGHRILIVSPVRNEAAHLPRLAHSLRAQSRRPDVWLVIDDGSTDDTPATLAELAQQTPFMRVLRTPSGHTREGRDRHALAAAPRAFNCALASVDVTEFTHIGKLDGDIELAPGYFAQLLCEFDANPRLGVGGGVIVEPDARGRWHRPRSAPDHVRGALKLYRGECFAAIGGVRERLGWDGIDQVMARMRGYETRSFDHLVARHHRPTGSTAGLLRARVRGGETYYVIGHSPAWAALKALKSASLHPRGVSTVAFLYGSARAARERLPRMDEPEYRTFLRADERRRLVSLSAALRRGYVSRGGRAVASRA